MTNDQTVTIKQVNAKGSILDKVCLDRGTERIQDDIS